MIKNKKMRQTYELFQVELIRHMLPSFIVGKYYMKNKRLGEKELNGNV